MNGLDLFSGIGGISYALQDFVRPVAYCEIEPYCQSVLLSRMQTGDLPKAPIWDDVCTLPFGELPQIDIIYGGFPCQDISVAGFGKGLEGERSGLFFEIMRLAQEIKPSFLFLENVPAITGRGGLRVVREIAEMVYDCRSCVISASGVGALHRRERWFLLANAMRSGLERQGRSSCGITQEIARPSLQGQDDSNPEGESSEQASESTKPINHERQTWGDDSRLYRPFKSRDDWQKAVSEICRVTDGISNRVERTKALGNSVVPQQVQLAWRILTGIKND